MKLNTNVMVNENVINWFVVAEGTTDIVANLIIACKSDLSESQLTYLYRTVDYVNEYYNDTAMGLFDVDIDESVFADEYYDGNLMAAELAAADFASNVEYVISEDEVYY